jgi:hypothetical protein
MNDFELVPFARYICGITFDLHPTYYYCYYLQWRHGRLHVLMVQMMMMMMVVVVVV